MTDRKPALKQYEPWTGDPVVRVVDLPPPILALTAPELAALAVFAEAMPEIIGERGISISMFFDLRDKAYQAALAAAKEAGHE